MLEAIAAKLYWRMSRKLRMLLYFKNSSIKSLTEFDNENKKLMQCSKQAILRILSNKLLIARSHSFEVTRLQTSFD